jgi:nitrite reductase (NADH) small subunit
MSWTSLCELSELKEGCGKYVEIDGFHLALFLHAGQPRVLDDLCPHAGGSLATGFIDNDNVVCPLHYWSFHVETGQMPDAPQCAIRTYPTRLLERPGRPPLVQADLPIY